MTVKELASYSIIQVPHRHTLEVTDSISDIDVVEWYRATRIERVARTFENNRRTYLSSCTSQQGHIDTLNCRPSQSLFPSQNICFEWSGTEMPDASSNSTPSKEKESIYSFIIDVLGHLLTEHFLVLMELVQTLLNSTNLVDVVVYPTPSSSFHSSIYTLFLPSP